MKTLIWNLGTFNAITELLTVPENGVVVVAGAYKGDYLHYFSERFPTASFYGFEPQPDIFKQLRERLGWMNLFPYGLATRQRQAFGGKGGTDGCSVYAMDGECQEFTMVDAVEALSTIGKPIDLLLLNCEGGEWALLPYLLDEMMHHRIASIALQQHTKYASKERIARVLAYLAEYYDCIFDDGKLDGWSYWRRK